jgi:hypothetical protein
LFDNNGIFKILQEIPFVLDYEYNFQQNTFEEFNVYIDIFEG